MIACNWKLLSQEAGEIHDELLSFPESSVDEIAFAFSVTLNGVSDRLTLVASFSPALIADQNSFDSIVTHARGLTAALERFVTLSDAGHRNLGAEWMQVERSRERLVAALSANDS